METVAVEVSKAINDLPVALRNIVIDFENMDLITPNRLRLTKVFSLKVIGNHLNLIEENKKIFNV